MLKHYFGAIATLVGVIIGAGVLGIPYVVAKAGFLTGLITLVLVGLMVLFVNLFLGEVVLRTPGKHQLTGYAEKYLGKFGKELMAIAMIIGIYGALIAYFIGEGEALAAIFGGNPIHFTILFFAFAGILVYLGIKAVENSELVLTTFKLLLFAVIFFVIIFSGKFKAPDLTAFNLPMIFLPYGVIVFACAGAVAIPEMREELGKNLKYLRRAVFIGTLIPIAVYLLFAFSVIGVTAMKTTEIATIGLGEMLGKGAAILVNLFAVIAMATSFIALALALIEMYNYDYKLNKNIAFLLTCVVPFLIVMFGLHSFVKIIGFTGAIAGGIEACLIVLMFYAAKRKSLRKPEYSLNVPKAIGYIIMALFAIAAAYTVISIF